MINNEQLGQLNATVLLLWLTAAAIDSYEYEGVYYNLIEGNHVMHFRQSYWKTLVQGTIKQICPPMASLSHSLYDIPRLAPRMDVLF